MSSPYNCTSLFTNVLLISTVSLLLSACTPADSNPAATLSPAQIAEQLNYSFEGEIKNIDNFRIDGWNYINNQALTLDGSPGTRYLVTLRDRCFELRSAQVIATTSTSRRLTPFDKIIVNDAGVGKRFCQIENLYLLQRKKEDEN